jgi:hypothetical protein
MDGLFGPLGFVDVYRRLHPETEGEAYTWWSNRGQAAPRTSAGASIIKWHRQVLPPRHYTRASSKSCAFRIMRR